MTSDGIVYLANPYSHPDPEVMENRYREAVRFTAGFTACGYIVFSPIVHSHPLAMNHQMATDWEFWKRIDSKFISVCSEVWVVKMDGWEKSRGVQAEIQIANELGIPVKYIDTKEKNGTELSANC